MMKLNPYGECPDIDIELIEDKETGYTEIDLGEED